MLLISEKDQQILRDLLAGRLEHDVTITYFGQREGQRESVLIVPGQEYAYCKETRELLEELDGLSDKVHLTVKGFVCDEAEARQLGITRIPAFVLSGQNKGKVRYFGIPSGYEFSSLMKICLISLAASPASWRRPALLWTYWTASSAICTSRSSSRRPDPTAHARPGWPTSLRSPIPTLRRT